MQQNFLQVIYLIGSITFIAGLKYLGNAKDPKINRTNEKCTRSVAIIRNGFSEKAKAA